LGTYVVPRKNLAILPQPRQPFNKLCQICS
jgi:hypothetical protein